MKPLVYLAGPYTSPDPIENIRTAVFLASSLIDSGLVAPIVPHLTGIWHMVDPHDYEDWLAYDFDVIEHCDALLRFGGEFGGADREVNFARDHNTPVFFDTTELISWALEWKPQAA